MTDLKDALEAIDRAGRTAEKIERQGSTVDRVVGSLSSQLEANGFSVRLARLYGLEDPRA